jgi:phosphoribosylpyrophosphate synthetase
MVAENAGCATEPNRAGCAGRVSATQAAAAQVAVTLASARPRTALATSEVAAAITAAASGSERIRQVSVAPLFAEAIRSIYEETSISRLFE